jgi:hypothetical protein
MCVFQVNVAVDFSVLDSPDAGGKVLDKIAIMHHRQHCTLKEASACSKLSREGMSSG